MSSTNNSSLVKAISELKKTIQSSLGDKQECTNALSQIEGTITLLEEKLANNLNFAPESNIPVEQSVEVSINTITASV